MLQIVMSQWGFFLFFLGGGGSHRGGITVSGLAEIKNMISFGSGQLPFILQMSLDRNMEESTAGIKDGSFMF